ncbi:MAG: phosphate-starvation-inducible PsiE family protein [Pseudomonadota bacterium]|uniref:phosphate-starvation-inducible PsiE family protein n=1 Tax=Thermithiobacillus tepidarius TaxID=929 RepID=UPI00040EDD10|nr:phosphate-starvation-inducible PsiE family protein [Thermithiobacillus tepidarius]
MDLKNRTMRLYAQLLDILVIGLILVMLVTLAISFYKLVMDLMLIFPVVDSAGKGVTQLVINVLGVFVLIELFRTFTDYVEFHRIRLHVLADVTIVFIMRELLIGLYGHSLAWPDLLAIAGLLAVLVGARTLAIRYPPRPESRSERANTGNG